MTRLLLICLTTLFCSAFFGCAPATYELAKIPSTQANLEAFRQCQLNQVAAANYETYERHKMFMGCLRSIPGMTIEIQPQDQLTFPEGCSHLVSDYPTVVLQCR
jgi:hypothetical protein